MKLKTQHLIVCIFISSTLACTSNPSISEEKHLDKVLSTKGLIALWDFKEQAGEDRIAQGKGDFPLSESNGEIVRVSEGPLSGYSAKFDSGQYFSLAHEKLAALNIHGTQHGVTVMAWTKWSGKVSSFIAGIWNEYQDGGKRQYGLFVSLPHYNGANQVCGHISQSGKPTPPFPYSIDYSASKQDVEKDTWTCVAFTYDGEYIKSFYNGNFEKREEELIMHTQGFEGYPEGLMQRKNPYYYPDGMGDNGSDFTVGAVLLKGGMGNYYQGLLGGVAVFDRALSEDEMQEIAIVPAHAN